MSDEVLVCMSADAELVAQGSTFDRKCATCDTAVALAPSGQLFMVAHPAAEIMCFRCWSESDEDFGESQLAADPETIRHEMRTATPNLRRTRN
jgi:hypothetical protein